MDNIKVLGIDLAKNVFQIHGTNSRGKKIITKRLKRDKLVEFLANLPPCLIGIEACGGSHYWARVFRDLGHTVKIMAPQFVKPYVRSNKNDRNDARGIAEAVTRPDMKFVPIKSICQQDNLLIHRARELSVKQKIAQANQIRGLLMEYGIIIPKGIHHIKKLCEILEAKKKQLTPKSEEIFKELYEQFKHYEKKVAHYDQQLEQLAKEDPLVKEIMKIEGLGPISATAVVATIGDAKSFKNGREVSAWLGLVPKQYSSGDKIQLGGISKRGDRYVRKLLIQGARSVVKACEKKTDKKSLWVAEKKRRSGYNRAAVALANKNARIIWAIMASGECYRPSAILQVAA